ncbi:MAG: translocation/assembly module TamB domain-containing protein [Acidobacteria bacterium]|nr:translocation/assembly module TamB domain-containing protein [Acidobacteriota bacterium]
MSRRRILVWLAVAVPAVAIILILAAAAILHSKSFQAYALGKLIHGVEESTGAQIRVQSMDVNWHPLAIELFGISAVNPAAATKTPLLSTDRLQISLQIWPLLHHQLQIDSVTIDHPVIFVRTESDGHNNLPAPPQARQSSSSTMAVQIGHLTINSGLLQYDDRQMPLSAVLAGFRTQVDFDRLTNTYEGVVAYDSGRLETAQTRTFEHRAELHFSADAKKCTIESLDVAMMHSKIVVRGELENYANPEFAGQYQAQVSGEDLTWILKDASLPTGDFALQGKATYRTSAGAEWAQRTFADGTIETAAMAVPSGQSKVAIRALHGTYQLRNGELHIDDARAEVFGGRFISDANVVDLVHNSGKVHFTLRGASVDDGIRLAGTTRADTTLVASTADLDVSADWKGSTSNAIAHARAQLHSIPNPPANANPVDGTVVVDYDAARNRASFQQSSLRTGNTELSLSGVVSKDSALQVRLTTHDLHELGELASVAAPSDSSRQISAYDVHGAADLNGKVSGAVAEPHFEGQLSVTNLQFSQTQWKSVRAHVALDSRSVAVSDGSLVNAKQGRMTFDAKTRLINWSPDRNAAFTAHAHIDQLSATDLEKLTQTNYPIEGLLSGELTASGTQKQPQAKGHLELAKAVVYNEPLSLCAVDINADEQTIHLNGNVRAAAGAMTAKLAYQPTAKHYEIAVNTDGLQLEKVQALQRSAGPVNGNLTASISGSGTIDNPNLTAHLQIPELAMHGETFHQVDAQLDAKGKHTEFHLNSNVEQTSIQAKGSVELAPGYPAKVTLDTGKVPIGALLTRFVPNSQHGADGELEIHGTLQGPLQTPAQLQGHVEIPTLQLQAQTLKLANASPIRINYRSGVVTLESAELKGQDTDVRLSGTVPVQGGGAMNVAADGSVNLNILQPWTDGGHSSGMVNIQMKAQGPLAQPVIDGRVRIENAVISSDDLPVGIEAMNGDINISGNRVNITNLSANAGGGTIKVTGTATYGKTPNFNLAMQANSVRIRQSGVRSVMNADLAWNGSTDSSLLTGRVIVDKLAFNQGSDLSEILANFSGDETVSDPSSIANNIKLNVAVQSSQNLNLASSQLSIAGSASLTAQGTAATPVLLGRILLTNGEVFFLGKRFEISSGTISFSNPVRTDPVVNLQVKTTIEQYNITASIIGPVDQLKTTYTSDPALPTGDIINLLAFGQTTAESASNGNTPASAGAESAVASAAGGQVASQVQKLTGISQLTLNPLAGSNANPGSQVAIQQRVSGNILLTFSTDITNAQNQSIQIQYQVNKKVSVSVLRDENGGYGIDMHYHKVF